MGIETSSEAWPSPAPSLRPMRLNFPMGIETKTALAPVPLAPSRPMRLNFPMGIETNGPSRADHWGWAVQ